MAFIYDGNGGKTNGDHGFSKALGEGLKSYQYFKQRLHEEVLRSQRRQHPFALMRIAVEEISDEALERFYELLGASVREYDLVCEVQSSEYAIVLPETTEKYAEKVANRIRQIHAAKMKSENQTLTMPGTKIGIACFPYDGTNAEDLLLSAEQDLDHQRKRRAL